MECNVCGKTMKKIAEGKQYIYFRCSKCHWYSTEEKEKSVDFDYEDYKTFDENLPAWNSLVEEAIRILDYKFKLIYRGRRPLNFLDIGCSEGVFVEAFNRMTNTNNAVGIEISKSKVQRGQEKGLKVYTYDNAPKEKFDFVLLRHVIEHIERPMEYLHTISEYVSDNGVLCIETPHNENYDNTINGNYIHEDRFLRDLYPPTHVCGFTPRTLRYVGRGLGLMPIKIVTHDVRNVNFYYESDEGPMPLFRRALECIGKGSNVVAFYKKKT